MAIVSKAIRGAADFVAEAFEERKALKGLHSKLKSAGKTGGQGGGEDDAKLEKATKKLRTGMRMTAEAIAEIAAIVGERDKTAK
jgi:hypothetical protein